MCKCINVQIINVQMYRCANVPMYQLIYLQAGNLFLLHISKSADRFIYICLSIAPISDAAPTGLELPKTSLLMPGISIAASIAGEVASGV